MPKQDDVYVISEEDILQPFRKGEGNRQGLRATAPAFVADDPAAEGAVGRRPASRGSARALVASTLSLFVCGAGQAYNGQWKLGLLLFLTEALAVASHWSLVKLWPVLKDLGYIFAIGELEIFLFLAVADFLVVFFLLYNVAQAYHQAEMYGRPFRGLRRPILAALASTVVPGWGQILNAQLGKALFFLFWLLTEIYVVTLLMLSPFFSFLATAETGRFLARKATVVGMGVLFVSALMWVVSVYDAFLVARYRRSMA